MCYKELCNFFLRYGRNGVVKSREVRRIKGEERGGKRKRKKKRNAHAKKDI